MAGGWGKRIKAWSKSSLPFNKPFEKTADDQNTFKEYKRKGILSLQLCFGETFGLSFGGMSWWTWESLALMPVVGASGIMSWFRPAVSCPFFDSAWLANKRDFWIIYEDSFVAEKCEWKLWNYLPNRVPGRPWNAIHVQTSKRESPWNSLFLDLRALWG